MELEIVKADASMKSTGKLSVSEENFARDYNEDLVHQVLVAYQAGSRSGTKAQKTRSEVSGGGKKPWRQKGTGRARAGTTRGPIWRAGGVAHAAKPRDFDKKVNKKMYRAALKTIFSELLRSERLIVVDAMPVKSHKTAELMKALTAMNIDNALLVTSEIESDLFLAARNLPKVEVRDVDGLDPVSLVRFEKVVVTADALKQIEERL